MDHKTLSERLGRELAISEIIDILRKRFPEYNINYSEKELKTESGEILNGGNI